LSNLRWLDHPGQGNNRIVPETTKATFVIVKDGVEKISKLWAKFMNVTKKPMETDYTEGMISGYARKKQNGFSYKEYPDLEGEVWKLVSGSKTSRGHWEISDMKRVKRNTKHASNVLWGNRLGRDDKGYPMFGPGGKWKCHIVAFKTFYPDLWAAKKEGDMVLHEKDDKEDFRPHKLRLGTESENKNDAYANGSRDGTKTERMRCVSYIDGIPEKEHESQHDAARYLKTKGCANGEVRGIAGHIREVISGDRKTAYGRTWVQL
jgi:hypothetical protein